MKKQHACMIHPCLRMTKVGLGENVMLVLELKRRLQVEVGPSGIRQMNKMRVPYKKSEWHTQEINVKAKTKVVVWKIKNKPNHVFPSLLLLFISIFLYFIWGEATPRDSCPLFNLSSHHHSSVSLFAFFSFLSFFNGKVYKQS